MQTLLWITVKAAGPISGKKKIKKREKRYGHVKHSNVNDFDDEEEDAEIEIGVFGFWIIFLEKTASISV